jgi:hypothetical protein
VASARAARALPGIALGIASDHRQCIFAMPLEGAIELRPVGSQCKTLRIKLFFTSGAILLVLSTETVDVAAPLAAWRSRQAQTALLPCQPGASRLAPASQRAMETG